MEGEAAFGGLVLEVEVEVGAEVGEEVVSTNVVGTAAVELKSWCVVS